MSENIMALVALITVLLPLYKQAFIDNKKNQEYHTNMKVLISKLNDRCPVFTGKGKCDE